jgi:hypothetical protein
MKDTQVRGLRRRRVAQVLSKTKYDRSAVNRIDAISRHFLGYSYKPNPLIGSADTAEVFTASLDGFDCVTYIETVLALARASNVDEFLVWLRKIRYQRGCIRWELRNHYMTFWIRNNLREGIVRKPATRAVPTLSKERVLNVVAGLAPRRARMKYMPTPAVRRLERNFRTGDLIFFVSTRKHLDVFHAGILVREGNRLLMRHASRSQRLVVEQELRAFLTANRMAGVIVVRPQEATRGGA